MVMEGSFSRMDSKDAVGEFTDMWVRMQDLFLFCFCEWIKEWVEKAEDATIK